MRGLPHSMVSLFVFVASACTSTEPAPASTPASDPAPAAIETEPNSVGVTEGPEYFFAVVGQTGVRHCDEATHSSTWLALRPTLGFVTASGVELDALMDRPVLARGHAGPLPPGPRLTVEPGPCPTMQMRWDWRSTPRGARAVRSPTPDIEHFHATSVRPLDELSVVREGETIVASFQNPLPFALRDVALQLYYEGCYAKPNTTNRASDRVTLDPGETLTQRFDPFDGTPTPGAGKRQSGAHRAFELVLSIPPQPGPDGAAIHSDLAVSLRILGVDIECP